MEVTSSHPQEVRDLYFIMISAHDHDDTFSSIEDKQQNVAARDVVEYVRLQ